MKHHLHVELAETPSSLLRLVACLHARHLIVDQIRATHGNVCLVLSGPASAARVQATVARLIDVNEVADGRPTADAHPWFRSATCCR